MATTATKKPNTSGSETRTSILPTMDVRMEGFLGSAYNPADAMLAPSQIGVRAGSSMDDVVAGVKGVGFYIDQIGFGAPSSGLTRGMPLKPLGVNYFIKTGNICSNGAAMWYYMEGIPKGDALGTRVTNELRAQGFPELKGLAPGIIEDAKSALNPEPLMNAILGSGYPQCKKVTRMVGDSYGRIQDQDTGVSWITEPNTATWNGGTYVQTKWVQDTDGNGPISLSRDEWTKAPKTMKEDGTPEGFQNMLTRPPSIVVIGVLCLIAYGFMKKR
jgi:hypothetical protein